MDNPSVTFTGIEVALVVAMIADSLPHLGRDDYEVADLMLDKAMGALHRPLAPDIEARLAALRHRPDLEENIVAAFTDRARDRRGWISRLLGFGQHRSS